MSRAVWAVGMVLLGASLAWGQEGETVKLDPQQFKLAIEITWNSVTLQQAANLEKKVKRIFAEQACRIDSTLSKSAEELTFIFHDTDQ